jgi:proteasome accessory factor B
VEIVYASPKRAEPSTRKVDPYGLVLRRGVWSLVGYCHLRQGLRTFHVHRIRALKMNASKPRTHDFEVPASFAIDTHVPHAPWQWGIEPPIEVRLELQGPLAAQAGAHFPDARVERSGDRTEVVLTVSLLDALLKHVLALWPQARVVSPEPARARLRALAQAVASRHGGRA